MRTKLHASTGCVLAAKLGTLGLMHDAAPMLAKKGQRIGAVAPTMVNTGLVSDLHVTWLLGKWPLKAPCTAEQALDGQMPKSDLGVGSRQPMPIVPNLKAFVPADL